MVELELWNIVEKKVLEWGHLDSIHLNTYLDMNKVSKSNEVGSFGFNYLYDYKRFLCNISNWIIRFVWRFPWTSFHEHYVAFIINYSAKTNSPVMLIQSRLQCAFFGRENWTRLPILNDLTKQWEDKMSNENIRHLVMSSWASLVCNNRFYSTYKDPDFLLDVVRMWHTFPDEITLSRRRNRESILMWDTRTVNLLTF